MKKDYIIVSPKYSKSNGVRTLYRLADALKMRGYNVYMFSPMTEGLNYNFIAEITKEMQENAIVIYPELIYGNPLNFKNVVRYVLYYPGVNGGDSQYDSREYIVSFDPVYYPDVDVLSIPGLDKTLFYEDTSVKKDIDCYFVYKGGKWRNIEEFNNMVEINCNYPENRTELADLLRKTKILYSYDEHTLLLDEAIACGCEVKIVRENCFEDYNGEKYKELFKNYESQLENFILVSQAMENKEKIKRRNLSKIKIYRRLQHYKHKLKTFLLKFCFNKKQEALFSWFKAELKLY